MAPDKGLYNNISTINNKYYPQQIALQFEALKLRPALYSLKQLYMPYSQFLAEE